MYTWQVSGGWVAPKSLKIERFFLSFVFIVYLLLVGVWCKLDDSCECGWVHTPKADVTLVEFFCSIISW